MQRKHQYANCDETDEDIFYFLYLCILNFTIMGEYYCVMKNIFLQYKKDMLNITKFNNVDLLQGVKSDNMVLFPGQKLNWEFMNVAHQ